jgi:hypothetical protein
MAASAQRIPPAHERDLRGARALPDREVAVDELAVVEDGHGQIVEGPRDTSSVVIERHTAGGRLTIPT